VKVRALVQIFEERWTVPRNYYDCAAIAANNLSSEGVELHKNNNKNDLPIDRNTFYKQLKLSIEERLLSNDDCNFVNWTYILDPKSWPENVAQTFGEKEIQNLGKRLQLNERESVCGFRDYLNQKILPENLVDLKNALNTVPISSSEYERRFSLNEPHPHFNKGIPFNDSYFGALARAGCWAASSLLSYEIC
jgi:hypothetical protein